MSDPLADQVLGASKRCSRRPYLFWMESSADSVMYSKSHIRQKLISMRKAVDVNERLRLDAMICNNVRLLAVFERAATVALYVSVNGEVDLSCLMDTSKRFVFPKIVGEAIRFSPAESAGDFSRGTFGIMEPTSCEVVSVSQIDLIMVPGLAFDRRGYRIGYGKGYYDRLLADNPGTLACGVCLEDFLLEKLPVDSWDKQVNFVATERMIYKTECEVQ